MSTLRIQHALVYGEGRGQWISVPNGFELCIVV
jgi:hypothetical protein